MRWIFAFAGAVALGGLGACAAIGGLGDYSNGEPPDASLTQREPDAAPHGDGASGDGAPNGGDAGGPLDDDAGEGGDGGCGTALDTVDNCGACGVSCELSKSVGASCGDGGCSYTGCTPDWLDCDMAAPNTNGCESSITSTSSCGACGNVCDSDHSLGASCIATDGGAPTCQYTGCAPGWADCNTTAPDTDGCETSLETATNCGACGKACDAKTSQGATCADGMTCSYTGCDTGYVDCNTTAPDLDGCETKVPAAACNSCGQACDMAQSNGAACNTASATCTYTSCKSGFADCNTTPPDTNGCETAVTTTANCGGCGKACDTKTSTGAACNTATATATCTYTGCATGYRDCDQTTAPDLNGCETPTDSTSNCGGCKQACSTSTGQPSCNGSTCSYKCNSGQSDCNGSAAPDLDGCECATPGCCTGGKCQTTHSDGVGQNFFDCNAAGTHTETQAQSACQAFTGSASACTMSSVCCGTEIFVCIGTTADSICGMSNGTCYCWQYSGQQVGRVEAESASSCKASCGSSSDPTWN